MASLIWVIRYCIDRWTFSWKLKLDNPLQNVGSAFWMRTARSDETTRKSMSCHRMHLAHLLFRLSQLVKQRLRCHRVKSEFHALKKGCVVGMLVMSLKGVGTSDVDGQTRDLRGTHRLPEERRGGLERLRIKHIDTRHLWSPEDAKGLATST